MFRKLPCVNPNPFVFESDFNYVISTNYFRFENLSVLGRMTFQKEFKKWGHNVSIHAIPFIAGGQKLFLKVVWIVSLLVSIGLCMYLLITIISAYFNYEVNTVVQMERDSDRFFPTISFCSRQICGVSNYSNDFYLEKYLKETYNLSGGFKNAEVAKKMNEMDWSKDEVFRAVLESFYKNYNNKDEFTAKKVSLKESLISCEFNGTTCDENYFEFFQVNEYQKCYKFNSGKFFNDTENPLQKTQRYGKKFGLHVELFMGKRTTCASPFSKTSGLLLYIHNNSYPITEELMQNGIEVAMGSETSVGVDRLYVSKLPLPYNQNNPCVDLTVTDSFANQKVEDTYRKNNMIYSQKACLQMCQQEFFARTQQCSAKFLPFGDPKMASCNRTVYQNESLSDNDSEYLKCRDMCLIDCEEFRFQFTVSSSEFPSTNYVDALQRKADFRNKFTDSELKDMYRKEIRGSLVAFNVFYQTDLYRAIVDSPKMVQTTIVSQVGNYTGLFLGASFLSVVEVCSLGLNLALAFGLKKKKNAVAEASSSTTDSTSESEDED